MQSQTKSSRNTRFHTENAGGTPEDEAVLPWSIAVPNVKTMQFAFVEREVRKCYENSYSANIVRIDRLYISIRLQVRTCWWKCCPMGIIFCITHVAYKVCRTAL